MWASPPVCLSFILHYSSMYVNTNPLSQRTEESLRGPAEGEESKPQWDVYKEMHTMSSPYTHIRTRKG